MIYRFRNAMDPDSVRERMYPVGKNPVYELARTLAGGDQSAFTVDRLAAKLRLVLPGLVSALAADVELGNAQEHRAMQQGRDFRD